MTLNELIRKDSRLDFGPKSLKDPFNPPVLQVVPFIVMVVMPPVVTWT